MNSVDLLFLKLKLSSLGDVMGLFLSCSCDSKRSDLVSTSSLQTAQRRLALHLRSDPDVLCWLRTLHNGKRPALF